MNFIPICSKQIAYVRYDDKELQMVVQYHTGQTRTVTGINQTDYERLIHSSSPYDFIVRLTEQRMQPET